MSEPRKFFKTEVTLTVLSEDEPWDGDLQWLSYDVTEGHYVGYNFRTEPAEVGAEDMVSLLYESGSDPSFFELDEDQED